MGIKAGSEPYRTHFQISSTTRKMSTMSANQTELRIILYHHLLQWFGQQPDLAPMNSIHYSILWQIYQFLISNVDIWGSPDVQALFVMGDALVALYDTPMDVVDLTKDDNEAAGEGPHRDDSGIAEL